MPRSFFESGRAGSCNGKTHLYPWISGKHRITSEYIVERRRDTMHAVDAFNSGAIAGRLGDDVLQIRSKSTTCTIKGPA